MCDYLGIVFPRFSLISEIIIIQIFPMIFKPVFKSTYVLPKLLNKQFPQFPERP